MSALVAALSIAILGAAPTPGTDDTRARVLFQRAEAAYGLGDIEEALEGYQAAYDALPLPGFLFNIAQCHRRLRQPDRAVFFYERYLELAPTGPNRAVAARLLEEQRALLPSRSPPPPLEPAATMAITAPPPVAAPPVVAPLRASPRRPPAASGDRRRWWLWAGAAALVVAAGTTAALAIKRDGPLPTGPLGSIDRR